MSPLSLCAWGQVETLSQHAETVTRGRQKLEAEAAKRKSEQSTMSKAVKNLTRQARAVVDRIHETEMGERERPTGGEACHIHLGSKGAGLRGQRDGSAVATREYSSISI